WPAGDLALQEAARIAFGLAERPSTKDMLPLAEAWRPHRAVAARVLWTYYRAVKGREGAPTTPQKSAATPTTKKSVSSKSKLSNMPSKTKSAKKHREKKHAR
ncbi:MAG: DNA-3-methyladenine glycosylase 2 family protein, partial [Xanthobacteraceae bacterium]